jgi:hypothetical protein
MRVPPLLPQQESRRGAVNADATSGHQANPVWRPDRPHGTQAPMELEAKILTMASFKGGENSTDPRRCTAHSSQTGKRCKNASIPGGRICRYHGGAAPHVQKKAAERLLALEHPAIDAMARILDPKQTAWTRATRLSASTVAAIAKDVLDRTGHKQREKLEIESRQTVDVRTLSTGLIRQLAAEIKQQEARNRAALTPGPPADDRPED